MKAPIIPILNDPYEGSCRSSHEGIIPDMTPKYPTMMTISYDLVVVGDTVEVIGLTKKILESIGSNESVLVILPKEWKPEHDIVRLYPPKIAMLDAANGGFVNRQVTEWICGLQGQPTVSKVPSVFKTTEESNCFFFKVSPEATHVKTKKVAACISELLAGTNSAENPGSSSLAVAEDFVRWRTLSDRRLIFPYSPYEHSAAILNDFNDPRLTVIQDTVNMINYKFNIVGTRRQRYRFTKGVIYAAAMNRIADDCKAASDAKGAIRFFPPIADNKREALRDLVFDATRLIVCVDIPIWKQLNINNHDSVYVKDILKDPNSRNTYHIRPISEDTCEVLLTQYDFNMSMSTLRMEVKNITDVLRALLRGGSYAHRHSDIAVTGLRLIYGYSEHSNPITIRADNQSMVDVLQESLVIREGGEQPTRKVFFGLPGLPVNVQELLKAVNSKQQRITNKNHGELSPRFSESINICLM